MEKQETTNNICQVCKGNGYIKIPDPEDKKEINIHQCWECESEGEFYVHESEISEYDDVDNNDRNTDKLLH